MKAREFLAQKKQPFEERDLLKQPLSEAELKALAKRLGGIRELVAPKRKEETASLSDAELPAHLAKNPGHVRRPLIDTGDLLTAGFTSATREQLEGKAGAAPRLTPKKRGS
jgi:arsenate reductase-like glutaredoxin family protein